MEGIVSALIASATTGVSFVMDIGEDGAPAKMWTDGDFEQFVGIPAADALARDLFTLIHPEDLPIATAAFGSLLVGKGASMSFRALHVDGSVRRVHVDAHARREWPGGRVVKIYGRIFPANEAPGREAG